MKNTHKSMISIVRSLVIVSLFWSTLPANSTCSTLVPNGQCGGNPQSPSFSNNCTAISFTPSQKLICGGPPGENSAGILNCVPNQVQIFQIYTLYRTHWDELLERGWCADEVVGRSTFPTGNTCEVAAGDDLCG